MKVFPAVHYSMGGLWVDYEKDARGSLKAGSPAQPLDEHPRPLRRGRVDYQYHGANRLGANSLLSCIYGGIAAGPAVATYRKNLEKSAYDLPKSVFEKSEKREQEKYDAILKMNQDDAKAENPYRLQHELGETMLRDCTIERHNGQLDKVLAKIGELDERAKKIKATDTSPRSNQGAQFVRHFQNMLVLARVIAQGARNRDESRGAHYKPDFPKRNDAEWLRTTLAMHDGAGKVKYVKELDYSIAGAPVHVTDEVDVSLVAPRERKYEQAGAASAAATGKLSDSKQASAEKA
jgi:succinate dehydrogenase / fumarate reductase flavoprotein subunit